MKARAKRQWEKKEANWLAGRGPGEHEILRPSSRFVLLRPPQIGYIRANVCYRSVDIAATPIDIATWTLKKGQQVGHLLRISLNSSLF